MYEPTAKAPPWNANEAVFGIFFAPRKPARATKIPPLRLTGTSLFPHVAGSPGSPYLASIIAHAAALVSVPAPPAYVTKARSSSSFARKRDFASEVSFFVSASSFRSRIAAVVMVKWWTAGSPRGNLVCTMNSPNFAELVENVREHGVLLPVYYFDGRVLDGNRRALAGLQLGIPFERVVLDDAEAAARVLWSLHPERAHSQFAAKLPLMAAARMLGASPSAVAKLRRPPKIPKPYTPRPGREVHLRLTDPTRDTLRALCQELRCTVREALTACVWAASDERFGRLVSYHVGRDRAQKKAPAREQGRGAET